MIKTIAFDLGGVVMEIDPQQAVRHFEEIGVADAATYLDPYTQKGFFGALEAGTMEPEEFRRRLSAMVGRKLTHAECAYGWTGYRVGVPQANLRKVEELRQRGYRVVLLSNTNPYMMSWVRSAAFDGGRHGADYYFDALYLSYELRLMKPDRAIYQLVLQREGVAPQEMLFIDDSERNVASAAALGIRTYRPADAHVWAKELDGLLADAS